MAFNDFISTLFPIFLLTVTLKFTTVMRVEFHLFGVDTMKVNDPRNNHPPAPSYHSGTV